MCASAIYLINDIQDIDSDRVHPTKCRRPFAAGEPSTSAGWFAAIVLIATSAVISLALPLPFIVALGIYFIVTCLYSFWLKRIAPADVMALAGLYTLRVIGGTCTIAVEPSFWLLSFSMFFFLSLACLKRYSELLGIWTEEPENLPGRGYSRSDVISMFSLGVSTGCISVLVIALYINSPEVKLLYRVRELLWLICPAILYWILRLRVAAPRGRIDDDPVVFRN